MPAAALHSLRRILLDDRLAGRFTFVITHYAARLEDDRPDKPSHRMVNADAFLEVVADLPRGVLLCGHVHRRFTTQIAGVRPPLFCAGSTTKAGHEGLWVFDVGGAEAVATPGRWDGSEYVLTSNVALRI